MPKQKIDVLGQVAEYDTHREIADMNVHNMDVELKTKFKACCQYENTTMKAQFTKFMKKYVDKISWKIKNGV